MLMVLSMALLVAPAMQHRLVEWGNTSERLLRATTLYAGASLVPLAISLALATLTSHSPSPTSAASERGMVIWDSLPSSECPDFDLPNDRKGAQFPDRWVLSDADDASQTPPRPSYGRNNAGRGFFAGSDSRPNCGPYGVGARYTLQPQLSASRMAFLHKATIVISSF
jgi:hypothetical protein